MCTTLQVTSICQSLPVSSKFTSAGGRTVNFSGMAEADDTYSTTSSTSFPGSVSEQEWDARRYLYTNGVAVTDGTVNVTQIFHLPSKFEFDIRVGDVDQHTKGGIQLISEFVDDVLVTRIGIRAKINYKCKPTVRVRINIRKGDIASCNDVQKAYEYISYPATNLQSTYVTKIFVWNLRAISQVMHSYKIWKFLSVSKH